MDNKPEVSWDYQPTRGAYVCAHCREDLNDHVRLPGQIAKCLWQPTRYQTIQCIECHQPVTWAVPYQTLDGRAYDVHFNCQGSTRSQSHPGIGAFK